MGGNSSKSKQASAKSDALEQQITERANEKSPIKSDVKQSIKEHRSSERRSKSMSVRQTADQQADWDYQVAYGLSVEPGLQVEGDGGVLPPEVLASAVTVNGNQVAGAPEAIGSPNPLLRPRGPNNVQHGDKDLWGTLNQTTGQKRNRLVSNNSQVRAERGAGGGSSREDGAARQDYDIYQDMLNEAIIQSLLDQEQQEVNKTSSAETKELQLPTEETEDQILKEVLKISALEHDKLKGKIDLSHLKRKKNEPAQQQQQPVDTILDQKKGLDGQEKGLTDADLVQLAKFTAPKNLAPVVSGRAPQNGSKQLGQDHLVSQLSPVKNEPQENSEKILLPAVSVHSTNTMMEQKTNDNTTVNPSVYALHHMEEDSILKELHPSNGQLNPSPAGKLANNQAQARHDDFMNSGDFDVSGSPNKLDRQLEKIMHEQQQKTQDDEFEELILNIEKENLQKLTSPSSDLLSLTNKKQKKASKMTTLQEGEQSDFLTINDSSHPNLITGRNSQGGMTTILDSIRSPTDMGYDEAAQYGINHLDHKLINESDHYTYGKSIHSQLRAGPNPSEGDHSDSPIKVISNQVPKVPNSPALLAENEENNNSLEMQLEREIEADIRTQSNTEHQQHKRKNPFQSSVQSPPSPSFPHEEDDTLVITPAVASGTCSKKNDEDNNLLQDLENLF